MLKLRIRKQCDHFSGFEFMVPIAPFRPSPPRPPCSLRCPPLGASSAPPLPLRSLSTPTPCVLSIIPFLAVTRVPPPPRPVSPARSVTPCVLPLCLVLSLVSSHSTPPCEQLAATGGRWRTLACWPRAQNCHSFDWSPQRYFPRRQDVRRLVVA